MAPLSLMGTVVRDAMMKTVTVQVLRTVVHPLYKRSQVKRTRLFAHDETEAAQVGDQVMIQECRPLSKNKNFFVKEIVKRVEKV